MNLEQYPEQHQWNKMQEVAGNEDINLEWVQGRANAGANVGKTTWTYARYMKLFLLISKLVYLFIFLCSLFYFIFLINLFLGLENVFQESISWN